MKLADYKINKPEIYDKLRDKYVCSCNIKKRKLELVSNGFVSYFICSKCNKIIM